MRAEERLAQTLRDFVREQQQRRPSRSQAASLAQTLETMRRELGIRPDDQASESAGAYSPGDRVRVLSLNQEGTVTEDWDERLLVSIGSMKVMVEKRDVRREHRVVKGQRARTLRGDTRQGQTRLEAAARASTSLDVRGKRFAEAEPLVERWIDDALLAGTSPLRLVHGKGTGMLGRGLQEHLRDHPAVKSLRYGNEEEGSTGVTLIELRT